MPSKRVQQACEPCRRRKSKCSGEMPECSLCARLSRSCNYAANAAVRPAEVTSDPGPVSHPGSLQSSPPVRKRKRTWNGDNDPLETNWRERIGSLEATLSEVIQTLRTSHDGSVSEDNPTTRDSHHNPGLSKQQATSQSWIPSPANVTGSRGFTDSGSAQTRRLRLSDANLKSIAATYWFHCECQPLCLFHGNAESFAESFLDRDSAVIHSVIATANRFNSSLEQPEHNYEQVAESTAIAYKITMGNVVGSNVELPTLQAMCLLVLLDIDSGRPDRARMLCSMATALAQAAQLHLELEDTEVAREERKRCYWSILLLRRLLGEPELATELTRSSLPAIPQCSVSSPVDVMKLSANGSTALASYSETSFNIMEVFIKVSEVFAMAQVYVQTRGATPGNNTSFPWLAESLYNKVTTAFMSIGSQVPFGHRYRNMSIQDMTHDVLHRSRDFWAPWFLSRLMHHVIPCLLNHPLLLTLQMRGIRNVTEAFLHQSAFVISNHISWTMHFVDLMKSRGFIPSSPLMVYCVSVVATIELQRMYSYGFGRSSQRETSQENFDKCLDFISLMEGTWKYAARVANDLRALASDMLKWSRFERDNYITIDVARLLDMLEFRAAAVNSRTTIDKQISLFGPKLKRGTVLSGNTQHATQLPRITPVDREAVTGADGPGSRQIPSQQGSQSFGVNNEAMIGDVDFTLTDESLRLPAHAFFNGHYQDLSL